MLGRIQQSWTCTHQVLDKMILYQWLEDLWCWVGEADGLVGFLLFSLLGFLSHPIPLIWPHCVVMRPWVIFEWSIILLVICESPFYAIIAFIFMFDLKQVFRHIFVECYLLDISGALAPKMQNFPRNVVAECRREISRRWCQIFVLSKCNLNLTTTCKPWP